MAEMEFNGDRLNTYFNGDNSEQEESYIEDIFCDGKNEKELEHHLKRQFYELFNEIEGDDSNLDEILYKIHYKINTEGSQYRNKWASGNLSRWFTRIAALLILPLTIYFGIYFYKSTSEKKLTWIEIKAPAWSRVQFTLPDGTSGWLNSSSDLRYYGNFLANREVTLNGEAFFDVAKDKRSPFLVKTNEVDLQVTGTSFNIASYENEKNIEVVLEEGEVLFKHKGMNKSYKMKPNDLVIFDKTSKDYTTEIVEPHKYLSWTEGKLVFRNDPLDVIARRLERWYNVDVELNGFMAEDMRLRATFVDENLEEVLDILRRCFSIDYQIENGNFLANETYSRKKIIISSIKE